MGDSSAAVGASAFCGIAAAVVWWLKKRSFAKSKPQQYVWISDPVKFGAKRRRMLEGGADKLHVIADFDRTLTKCFYAPGQRGCSAHGAIERSPHLRPSYHQKARELFEHFHPLETSAELTIAQKLPFMKDWYHQGHTLLMEQGFRRRYLIEAVRQAPMRLREGAKELMTSLAKADIPLLVLSAGLGDVLEEFLVQKCGPLPASTHVISNRMVFEGDGSEAKLVGFSEPLIHMFNKSEGHSPDAPYYAAVHQRRNVILLGDGLGDLSMADGIDTDTIITVGFLNERIGELWRKYVATFDVVIVNDGDCSFVNDLVNDIVRGGQ